jgi:hypothetical protein
VPLPLPLSTCSSPDSHDLARYSLKATNDHEELAPWPPSTWAVIDSLYDGDENGSSLINEAKLLLTSRWDESDNRQICAGMYSQTAWGGDVKPHILVKFIKETVEDDSDPIASMVIFEWKDYDLIGVFPTADSVKVFLSSKKLQELLLNGC